MTESSSVFFSCLFQRKEWEDMGRMKPSILDKDKERQLQKIATRSVLLC